ncbi:hypothetical protein GCM10025857_14640 [Alicyclobacillus contaminans]|uniref:hypothetical protein n=1 Tax=Alicyclobacillus contaminans TaxID=392016 RepID=UPI00047E4243|nr:hypothetical protein [Alicyclobacillus contaminans]GMA50107.1 hypothetical protein GCM10025857_14640 [Alicyclobacillus contaminans]
MNDNSRQEIINSLLEYLPEIAASLGKTVSYLHDALRSEDPRRSILLGDVMTELEHIFPVFEKALQVDVREHDELREYHGSLAIILSGFKSMLTWLTNEEEPDESLTKAINMMFEGSQQLMNLISKITS